MKKLLLAPCVVLSMVIFVGVLFADNSKRVEELSKEGNDLIQRKQQMVETVQKIDVRLIQIQAVIEELKKQDDKKETKKKDE
jgi:hypothetical protein